MKDAKNRRFYKGFFVMLLVIAMQNVLSYGVNLADNIMLGAYSEDAMSAASLVNQIQFLLQMLVIGAGEAIIVIASRHWGEGDIASIKRVSSVGMRAALIFAGILFTAGVFFPQQFVGLLTNKPSLINEASDYLRIVAFSYPIFALTNILLAAMRSVETTKIGLYISVSTLLINVSLNYLLISGNLGFPQLGIRGAAIATLVSRIVELIIVATYVLLIDKKIRLRLKDFFKRDTEMAIRYVKVGLPVILSGGMWGVAMAVQTAILGRMEDAVVPANSIAATMFSIVTVFIYGSATSASVSLGKMIGENRVSVAEGIMTKEDAKVEIKKRSVVLQLIFVAIGILTSTLLLTTKGKIINFYDITDQTRLLADSFMTVLCVTMIGTAYQMPCLSGIIRAGGDTKFLFYNDLIFMWGLVLPLSFLGAFIWHLPPVLVFIFLKSDQILKCIVAVFKVNRFNWIKDI